MLKASRIHLEKAKSLVDEQIEMPPNNAGPMRMLSLPAEFED
jgi:hypothetical protein